MAGSKGSHLGVADADLTRIEVKMEIKYGAQVVDKNEKHLGSVDRLIRDTWSGEIKRFMICRKGPASDLFLRPEDVLEATDTKVKLRIAIDEPSENI